MKIILLAAEGQLVPGHTLDIARKKGAERFSE